MRRVTFNFQITSATGLKSVQGFLSYRSDVQTKKLKTDRNHYLIYINKVNFRINYGRSVRRSVDGLGENGKAGIVSTNKCYLI